MSAVHIHAPPGRHFAAVNFCPTCERPRRMLGWFVEWYGTTWTCAGCGDRWSDGERLERPFAPGWHQECIARARLSLASIGVQAALLEAMRVVAKVDPRGAAKWLREQG